MESSPDVNFFLDPNFALNLYCKFGKIREIVPKIKLIIGEFRRKCVAGQSKPLTFKSNSKSNELCDEAASILRNKDASTLHRVLELYNESICYAEPSNDGHLAILYASRASVYFQLRDYKYCLENISLAEEKGYPENGVLQLNELKTDCCAVWKCSENQEKGEKNVEIELNVKPHPQIPFAASCLELKSDPIGGRYITTNEDIEPGSVIVTESPFEKVLSSDCIYQRCCNCFETNSLNLIPCRKCTKAMFCSEKCVREAFESFHRFECSVIDCLMDVGGQITIRTFLKAVQSFSTIPELIELIQSTDSYNRTAFSFDHSEALSPQQHYYQIHSLSTNHDVRSESCLFTHVLVAALFYYQLAYNTPFKYLVNEEYSDSLMELMFRIELITTINGFSVNDLSSPREDEIIGTGLYRFSSLINHSCNPNASPKYYKNKLILYTTLPIKRGESISIGYHGSHVFLPKEERQSFLLGKYHFSCQCIACVNDFPLLHNMAMANIPAFPWNDKIFEMDKTNAETIYLECCAYLRRYYRHYPCREIYSAQKCLSKLLSGLHIEAIFQRCTGTCNKKYCKLYSSCRPVNRTAKLKRLDIYFNKGVKLEAPILGHRYENPRLTGTWVGTLVPTGEWRLDFTLTKVINGTEEHILTLFYHFLVTAKDAIGADEF